MNNTIDFFIYKIKRYKQAKLMLINQTTITIEKLYALFSVIIPRSHIFAMILFVTYYKNLS